MVRRAASSKLGEFAKVMYFFLRQINFLLTIFFYVKSTLCLQFFLRQINFLFTIFFTSNQLFVYNFFHVKSTFCLQFVYVKSSFCLQFFFTSNQLFVYIFRWLRLNTSSPTSSPCLLTWPKTNKILYDYLLSRPVFLSPAFCKLRFVYKILK